VFQVLNIEIKGEDLLKFENDVNEERGQWIYFDKLPPIEEEDPKKKAAAKGKVVSEEVKPVSGRAWIDLTAFQGSSGNSLEYKALLETVV
jgi:hypothetical protein